MPTDALDPQVQRELDAIDAALEGRRVDPDLTELGVLALALREERPEPGPSFAARLDEKAAAGFPRPSRIKWLTAPLSSPRVLAPGIATMLLALVVGGALLSDTGMRTGGNDSGAGGMASTVSDEESGGSGESGASVARPAPRSGNLDAGGQGAGSLAAPPPVPPAGGGSPASDRRTARKQERSASMTLVARPAEIDTVADRIVGVADANRGFVVSSSVGSTEDGGTGEFLLRVPTASLDRALAQLSRLAHVRERRQEVQDITAQHTSARSRLQDARAERRSLLRRLERAVTEVEADALKARLRDVTRRIGIARADLARVSNRATYANVAVSLFADPSASAAGDDGRWSPGDAARDAVRVLEVAAGVAVIALAVLLPIGILVAIGLLAARWSARRGRERALDAV